MDAIKVRKYLERIGITEEVGVSEEELNRLILANLTHVPFENLDTIEKGIAPSLDSDDIYKKIVEEHRGGWCFEQNKIFMQMLQGIGYVCYPIPVRICWLRPFPTAATHRATIVLIGDKKYLADVGYGGPGPKGLVTLEEGIQNVGGEEFRITSPKAKVWQVEKRNEGKFSLMLYFEETEGWEIDFELPNFYCAKNEKVIFSQRLVCNILTPNGSIGLNGNILTITEGEERTQKLLKSREDLLTGLKENFGLSAFTL